MRAFVTSIWVLARHLPSVFFDPLPSSLRAAFFLSYELLKPYTL